MDGFAPPPEGPIKKDKDVPYALIVQYETAIRDASQNWTWRTATAVLRGTVGQITNYVKRYAEPQNVKQDNKGGARR